MFRQENKTSVHLRRDSVGRTESLAAGRVLRCHAVIPLAVLLFAVSAQGQIVKNGSFESGYNFWTASGHNVIATSDPNHPATDGSSVVVLNIGDEGPGSVLSQTFTTKVGQRYELSFDYGCGGPITDQRLEVALEGNGVLFDQVILIAGIDTHPLYMPQRINFVANSTSTKLTFTDASYTYVILDSMLDNVAVTAINASAPLITAQPQRTATAQGQGAAFSVTASGATSYQWQFNGVNIPTATNSTFTIAAADTANAGNYRVAVTNASGSVVSSAATLTVLPPAILLNGNFEYGSAAWTFVGMSVATSTNPLFGISDGSVMTHFNWGQLPPNANIFQTFTTTPGQTYVVDFDLGAFSVLNQNVQRCRISVKDGSNNVLTTQDISVFATGTGGHYTPQELTFLASGTTATLTFQDISPTTVDDDLLLDNIRVRLQNAPLITAQPQNVTAIAGNGATFTVTAAGQAPLHYQWRYFNAGNWVNVGSDSSSFTIPTTADANNGAYDVVVSNGLGNAVSSSAVLTVITPGVFANGDFELDPFQARGTVTAWTVTGHVAANPEGATSGSHSAALSEGGDSQGDTLSQTFTTIPGRNYTVDFDAAIFGKRSGNPLQIEVQLSGNGTLSDQTLTPPEVGTWTTSAVTFQHYQIPFTANSTGTTLKFISVGTGNAAADQVVDSVKITLVPLTSPTPTPTPTATPTATPTPTGTPTPTATASPSASVVPLTNANFETGPFQTNSVFGWTVTGKVADNPEGATSGTHSAALSAGGDSTGDTLSQDFTTIPGRNYIVDFDAAIFGKRSGSPLRVQVQIIGNATLSDQTLTPPDAGSWTVSAIIFQHYQVAFTANSTTTTLKFISVGTGNASA